MSDSSDDDVCPDCEGHHWLHMGEPFEIQWCSSCEEKGDDGDAVILHRQECGCDWPDVDYQHLTTRFIEVPSPNRDMTPTDLRLVLHRFVKLAAEREVFAVNATRLISILGEALELYYKHWDVVGGRASSLYLQIQGTACCLVSVISLIERGVWKAHWTWDPDDGVMENGKWFARRPEGPFRSWDALSGDIWAKALGKHAPKLLAAMGANKSAKPELDHKKVYAALSVARDDLRGEDYRHHRLPQLEDALRHLLELHPDADVQDTEG